MAGVLVYTGSPDPQWPVNEELCERFQEIWERLPEWEGDHPGIPSTGYRGCFLHNRRKRWIAFGEHVVLNIGEYAMAKMDPNRECERMLLESVPSTLPPEWEFLRSKQNRS